MQLTYLTIVYVESGANNWSYVSGASELQWLLKRTKLGHTDMSYYIASDQVNEGIDFSLIYQLSFRVGVHQLKW
jgi:hypothetical protein